MLQKIPELDAKNRSFEGGGQPLRVEMFEFQGLLGSGSFGRVEKVKSIRTGYTYALKIIQKKQLSSVKLQEQLCNEISILCNCHHENIIKIFGAFEDKQSIYLILEYANGPNLYMKLKEVGKLPELKAAMHLRQVALALNYLHSQIPAIIHRDIKPENILFHDDQCKIADFGWSNKDADFRNTYCGTPDYLAPEMIIGSGHNEKLDIWTLGVLLYELLHGRTPFSPASKPKDHTNLQRLIERNIIEGKFEINPALSQAAQDAIRTMMHINPNSRPSIKQVLELEFLRQVTPLNSQKNGLQVNTMHSDLQKAKSHPAMDRQWESEKDKIIDGLRDKNQRLEKMLENIQLTLKLKTAEADRLNHENQRILSELRSYKDRNYNSRSNSQQATSFKHSPNKSDMDRLTAKIQSLSDNLIKQENTLFFLFKRTKDLSDFVSKFHSEHFMSRLAPSPTKGDSVNFEQLIERLKAIFNEFTDLKRLVYPSVRNRSAYHLPQVNYSYKTNALNVPPKAQPIYSQSRSPIRKEVFGHENTGTHLASPLRVYNSRTNVHYNGPGSPYIQASQKFV